MSASGPSGLLVFNAFCCLLIFFKINFFLKSLSAIPSECQTVGIQIMPDVVRCSSVGRVFNWRSKGCWFVLDLWLFFSLRRNQSSENEIQYLLEIIPGRVAQSVTCLVTDAKLTADPGVASSIPARSHTFVEIDHEIISTVILLSSAE